MTLANFPDSDPAIVLDFQKSRKMDPRVTFSRASTATYTKSGLIVTADTDAPRLTPEGLLVEESRTNLVEDSKCTDTGYWSLTTGSSIGTVASSTQLAPNGSSEALLMQSTVAGSGEAN